MTEADTEIRKRRLVMAAIGLLAGMSAYIIIDELPRLISNQRWFLAIATSGWVGFGATLAMAGPLPSGRAAIGGVLIALFSAALATWASFRFDSVAAYLGSGHPGILLALICTVFLPFWIAFARQPGRWNDYETLFDEAWRIIVRLVVAAVFSAVVWAVVWLSDALLGVVGITVIQDLLDIDIVPYALTGVMFGLALAVVHEFARSVTPYLPLRLLRLILPVVVAVTAVFLVVLPFRGLSNLFGDWSAAGTLMMVALAGVALVSIAVDRRDDLAVSVGLLRLSSRVMILFLPILGGLALWAVMIRVGQYGWTPQRLAAVTIATTLTAYGLAYLSSFLALGGWMASLRRRNVVLALLVAAVSVLFLTPLLDPQRISANSQLTRFTTGEVSVDDLDLWSLRDDWGRAGHSALDRLSAIEHPDAARMADRIEAVKAAESRYAFEAWISPDDREGLLTTLLDQLLVQPQGAVVPRDLLSDLPVRRLEEWGAACTRETDTGTAGCVAVVADFLPESPGEEVMILTLSEAGYVRRHALVPAQPGRVLIVTPAPQTTESGVLTDFNNSSVLDQIASGRFTVTVMPLNALTLGVGRLYITP